MKTRISAVVTAVVLLFCINSASAGFDMKVGMWEVTTKWELPGMPKEMAMPGVTFNQCLTSENHIPQNNDQGGGCKITRSQIRGNTVIWEMDCENEGLLMRGTGKVTFSGDIFTGGMTIESNGMNINQHLSGRRTGDCK